jgi:hypothetical protein
MILVSFLGCAAAKKNQSKTLVCCYLLFVTAILGLQIAAAVLAMQYYGVINESQGLASNDLINSLSIELNNGILSTYTACCTGCPSNASPACNNAAAFFANTTNPNCVGQSVTCSQVQVCGNAVTNDCYVFAPAATVKVPPVQVDLGLCTLFTSLTDTNNTALVGPAGSGSCGKGNPATFQTNVELYFSSRFYWVAVAFCIIAGIQLLVVLLSTYILCCITRKDGK